MDRDAATQSVLDLLTDEAWVGFPPVWEWFDQPATENVRDAAKYLEHAAQELLRQGGDAAAALREAAGCDEDPSVFEVLARVDWDYAGEFFWARYVEG